jgi:serine O-acetyltransferase
MHRMSLIFPKFAAMEESLTELVALMRRIVFPEYLGQDDRALDLMRVRSLVRKIAGDKRADAFMERIPEITRLLHTDVEAIADNDPAVTDRMEIVLCYPCIKMMLRYRTAHELQQLEVPVAPRLLTEMAHSATGIDIHPGAKIGEYFAIDHDTVVGGNVWLTHDVPPRSRIL